MTSLALALAACSLLSLLAVVLAAVAFCLARTAMRAAGKQSNASGAAEPPALQGLRSDVDGLAAQVHAMQQLPPAASVALPVRNGLNLAKRSQALRLHRHGNSPSEIASALEIPVQEVELLLKVQRIVIGNLTT